MTFERKTESENNVRSSTNLDPYQWLWKSVFEEGRVQQADDTKKRKIPYGENGLIMRRHLIKWKKLHQWSQDI